MTDLLMRLAERTLGTAPTARPIIAPMFAPAPALAVSESLLPVMEEVTESLAPAQQAQLPHSHVVSRPDPSIKQVKQQVTVSPGQAVAEVPGTGIQPRASRAVSSRQVASSTEDTGIETRREEIISATHEKGSHPAAVKGTRPPARVVFSSPLRADRVPMLTDFVAEESTPIVRAETVANPAPGKTPVDGQTFPPQVHEQFLARSFVEQRRESATLPFLEQREQARREVGPAHLPNQPPRSEVALPQSIVHEVIELGTSPVLAPQQQGNPAGEATGEQDSASSHRANRRSAPPGDQFMLVPTRNETQVIPQQQETEQAFISERLEGGSERRAQHQAVQQHIGQRVGEKQAPGTVDTPSETPTIRVTIGRIDVRAVTPAAPPARSKPGRAGPTVSLEEYSRQNKGGR